MSASGTIPGWVRLLAALAFAAAVHSSHAQVQLKSGMVQPSPETTAAFFDALRSAPADSMHGLASFAKHPDAAERARLETAGLHILAPIRGTTYRVRVEGKRLNTLALASSRLAPELLRLHARDRIDPALNTQAEKLYVTVRLHPGVPPAEVKRIFARHAMAQKQSDETWLATVTRASLWALAEEDAVQWIDAGPPSFVQENQTTRKALEVDLVQKWMAGEATGLGGKDIQVGLFDLGVDHTHKDFGSRIVRVGVAGSEHHASHHATHLAGIIIGDGALSDKKDSRGELNKGSPYQWRGMAPRAQLLDIYRGRPNGPNGADAAAHYEYITKHGMDLSNHSYAVNVDGSYDNSNQTRDQIIRGDATSEGRRVPARLHVTSAGNGWGYFRLTKQLKNALVVGNWDLQNDRIHESSSLGPAHDGRIKPDVVAPGVQVVSTGFCPNGGTEATPACFDLRARPPMRIARTDFYSTTHVGSSQASAVAAGVLALVLEQYRTTYGVDLDRRPPLPSTLRAVMIHTARDKHSQAEWFRNKEGPVKATPGPDVVTGWGLIDAKAAVETVRARLLLEGSVAETCEEITYSFEVEPERRKPVRVTLAWDDVAADSALASTVPKLVNDLDLVLIDPNGNLHYPWKLDQTVVGPLEACGANISTQRRFVPDPLRQKHAIPDGGVPVAERGADRLNNVEVVDAPAATGTWQAKILAFSIPQGPQSFSLVGETFSGASGASR